VFAGFLKLRRAAGYTEAELNGTLNVREEVFEIIGKMSENKLFALRDFLIAVGEESDKLSSEELALFMECERDRAERPESFAAWKDVRRN